MDKLESAISDFFYGKKPEEKLYKIEGKASFILQVIEHNRKLPFHTSTVAIKAYDKNDIDNQITIKTKWHRVIGGRHYELEELQDNDRYNFCSLDIGCNIKCIVEAVNNNFKGKLSVIFSQTKFDHN